MAVEFLRKGPDTILAVHLSLPAIHTQVDTGEGRGFHGEDTPSVGLHMNHESSGDPTRPWPGPRQSPFPIQSSAVERATEFLAQGSSNRERLGCADCLTAELCAAVVTELTEHNDRSLVTEKNAATLRGYGIEVGDGGYTICPGRLVLRAVSSELGAEFCVAPDDPVNQAEPYTRVAEVLRAATRILIAQLEKDMRI